MATEPLTGLAQEQLDWISRFADRLRLDAPPLADEGRGIDLNDVARDAWSRPSWRCLGPEAAAERWLQRRSFD